MHICFVYLSSVEQRIPLPSYFMKATSHLADFSFKDECKSYRKSNPGRLYSSWQVCRSAYKMTGENKNKIYRPAPAAIIKSHTLLTLPAYFFRRKDHHEKQGWLLTTITKLLSICRDNAIKNTPSNSLKNKASRQHG